MEASEAERRGARLAVDGVVLCGGLSRRLGEDKAAARLGERSLLERAVQTLRPLCDQLFLACGSRDRYAELGLPRVLDEAPELGPVSGLIAGLEAARASHVLAVACDMPFLTPELLGALVERAAADSLDVAVLASERGVEPLCAVYGRRCLRAMRAARAAGRHRVLAFLEEPPAPGEAPLEVGRLHLGELGRGATPERLTNVNTPEDLARARRHEAGEERS